MFNTLFTSHALLSYQANYSNQFYLQSVGTKYKLNIFITIPEFDNFRSNSTINFYQVIIFNLLIIGRSNP